MTKKPSEAVNFDADPGAMPTLSALLSSQGNINDQLIDVISRLNALTMKVTRPSPSQEDCKAAPMPVNLLLAISKSQGGAHASLSEIHTALTRLEEVLQ